MNIAITRVFRAAVLIVAIGLVASPAFCQQPKTPHRSVPSRTMSANEDDVGLSVTGSDGVSTRRVPAVPCGVAASEHDGTTSCIGIPGRVKTEQAMQVVMEAGNVSPLDVADTVTAQGGIGRLSDEGCDF